MSGPTELKEKVLDRDQCPACGLCVGLCPYIRTINERVAFIHPCGREEGRCFRLCPRTGTDPEALDRFVFGAARPDHVLGYHRAIYYARAGDAGVRARGQYGGVVSALVVFARQRGDVEGALLTGRGHGLWPAPRLARTRDEVLDCGGSRYSACPTLSLFHAVSPETGRLAVVGRPCQVTALRKMEMVCPETAGDRIGLVIGLFCFWALSPAFYRHAATIVAPETVTRMDIPPERFVFYLQDGGSVGFPIDEVRPFIRPACETCFDMTSELADVAVGATEHEEGWNTLIIRSTAGEDLLADARKEGLVEVKPFPPERLPVLKDAVLRKKERVLARLETAPWSYLQLSPHYTRSLRTAGGACA